MDLDNATVVFTCLLVSFVISLYMWVLALRDQPQWWRHAWALGNTGITLGVGLLLGQGTVTPWISTVLANLLILGGYFFLEKGVRLFCGKPAARWYAPTYFAILLVGYVLSAVVFDSMLARSILHSSLAIVALIRTQLVIRSSIKDLWQDNRWLLGGLMALLGFVALFYVARVALTFGESGKTVLDQSSSLNALFLFITLAMIGWSFGLTLMDIARSSQKLRASLSARDRLFSLVAHDLRGTSGGVMQSLGLVKTMEDIPVPVQETLELCHQSAQRNFQLVEKLLEWARSQTGGFHVNLQTLALKPLCFSCLDALTEAARLKHIDLTCEVDDLVAHADADALATVIRNLLSNAIKFTPQGGKVKVLGDNIRGGVRLRICDQGPGVPRDVRARLEKGLLPESTRGTVGEAGTGLGLSLCSELLKLQGGYLELTPHTREPEVWITLPRASTAGVNALAVPTSSRRSSSDAVR